MDPPPRQVHRRYGGGRARGGGRSPAPAPDRAARAAPREVRRQLAGENAPRAGAGQQIEVGRQRRARRPDDPALQRGEEPGAERPPQAAAVEGEDTKHRRRTADDPATGVAASILRRDEAVFSARPTARVTSHGGWDRRARSRTFKRSRATFDQTVRTVGVRPGSTAPRSTLTGDFGRQRLEPWPTAVHSRHLGFRSKSLQSRGLVSTRPPPRRIPRGRPACRGLRTAERLRGGRVRRAAPRRLESPGSFRATSAVRPGTGPTQSVSHVVAPWRIHSSRGTVECFRRRVQRAAQRDVRPSSERAGDIAGRGRG